MSKPPFCSSSLRVRPSWAFGVRCHAWPCRAGPWPGAPPALSPRWPPALLLPQAPCISLLVHGDPRTICGRGHQASSVQGHLCPSNLPALSDLFCKMSQLIAGSLKPLLQFLHYKSAQTFQKPQIQLNGPNIFKKKVRKKWEISYDIL